MPKVAPSYHKNPTCTQPVDLKKGVCTRCASHSVSLPPAPPTSSPSTPLLDLASLSIPLATLPQVASELGLPPMQGDTLDEQRRVRRALLTELRSLQGTPMERDPADRRRFVLHTSRFRVVLNHYGAVSSVQERASAMMPRALNLRSLRVKAGAARALQEKMGVAPKDVENFLRAALWTLDGVEPEETHYNGEVTEGVFRISARGEVLPTGTSLPHLLLRIHPRGQKVTFADWVV